MQLWFRGQWLGLILAVGFGALLNLLILATFVWAELLSPLHLRLGWLGIGSLWGSWAVVSFVFALGGPARRPATAPEVMFRDALSEYLRANWFEAETTLNRLLRLHPRDVEARLLLATLLRHTRRYDEAHEQLGRLERLEDSQRWSREIAAEKRLLDQGPTDGSEPNPMPVMDMPSVPIRQQAA
jgi:tetratricopeptide (TPR) repeat protein